MPSPDEGSAAWKPCPYCWLTPDEWDMADPPQPEGGFAPIHPECQEAVNHYVEEAEGV